METEDITRTFRTPGVYQYPDVLPAVIVYAPGHSTILIDGQDADTIRMETIKEFYFQKKNVREDTSMIVLCVRKVSKTLPLSLARDPGRWEELPQVEYKGPAHEEDVFFCSCKMSHDTLVGLMKCDHTHTPLRD